jgi:phage shock protein E
MLIEFVKGLFGKKINFAALLKQGAIIIDVRSPQEFAAGHIDGSLNIPLNEINNASLPKKDSIIITCCASGMRSAMAKNILKTNQYTQVYNGGGWASLQKKLN